MIRNPNQKSRYQTDPTINLSKNDQGSWSDIETARGMLHRLSERMDIQIKIRERLRTFFGRDLRFEWDRGNLKIRFLKDGDDYQGPREASGLLHLVTLLAALYNEELDALLLDEPDISLHPQLQAFLLREIREVAGDPNNGEKVVVIATHSPEMIHA